MTDPAHQKTALRQEALAVRDSLAENLQDIGNAICHQLESWEGFQRADQVLVYHPFRKEIDLLPLCEKYPDKAWYLPRTEDKELHFHRYRPGDPLQTHAYGMQEPLSNAEPWQAAPDALILLPALMADKAGYRLGYGQGFYDRFLASAGAGIYTAVVIPAALLQDALPHEPWDKNARAVVTDTGIFEITV